ncbi:unnamed protein product [Effrenium voratum]|nr:unnamed protein product [Effrenium voratum]
MDSADVVPGASLLVLGGVVVCIVCAVVLHHFAQREVGWIPFLAALFGCATSFIMLGLVPFDLSQARQLAWAEAQHRSMEKALEQSSWEMLYWVSFFLAWVIYPILSGYEASAGFTLAGRVMSLRGFWCFAYFAGIAALTVLLMIGGLPAAAPWCLALANAWALVVAANLMAYGLVAVPQQLWVLSTPGTQLKRLYCSAVALDEARLSTQFELKDVIAEARAETAQRSAQFWDPSLERGFAVLQLTMEECELLHLELTNGLSVWTLLLGALITCSILGFCHRRSWQWRLLLLQGINVLRRLLWLPWRLCRRNFWEDCAVFGDRKLAAHAPMRYYPSVAAVEGKSPNIVDLGEKDWRMHIFENPQAALSCSQVHDRSFDDQQWHEVPIPSNWQMLGLATPIYTNITFPFTPVPLLLAPYVSSRNPTALYRTHFTISAEQIKGHRVHLVFQAVGSAVMAWVDGQYVGYSQDSMTAAEFDITDALQGKAENAGDSAAAALLSRTAEGDHVLVAMVPMWCDGSYLEDQDQWWLTGLHRGVELHLVPELRLADYEATAVEAEGAGLLTVRCHLAGANASGASVRLTLGQMEPMTKTPERCAASASPLQEEGWCVTLQLRVPKVRPWSAEDPFLYPLLLEVTAGATAQVERIKVGFRCVDIRDGQLRVNRRPITIAGANVHEMHPTRGKAITEEDMILDIQCLKRGNFNAVRNCHYPHHPRWYELCDEYGLYVVDEANIETHGFVENLAISLLACDWAWRAQFLHRTRNMFQRAKNHCSVIVWSLGNESGWGPNFAACMDALRRWDPHERPVQYEGGQSHGDAVLLFGDGQQPSSDIICPMYWSPPMIMPLAANMKDSLMSRPVILCEYSHALGNSNGSLHSYWELFWSSKPEHRRMQGGFVWEWADAAVKVTRRRTLDPVNKSQDEPWLEGHYGYGGDFGPSSGKQDRNFAVDGILFPDRSPHPAYFEFKRLQQPVAFGLRSTTSAEATEVTVNVTNRYAFKDLGHLTLLAFLSDAAGRSHPCTFEPATLAGIPAGQSREFIVKASLPDSALRACGCWLTLQAVQSEEQQMIPAKFVVAEECLTVCPPQPLASSETVGICRGSVAPVASPSLSGTAVVEHGDVTLVKAPNYVARFKQGTLAALSGPSGTLLGEDLRHCFSRASTDNDRCGLDFFVPHVLRIPMANRILDWSGHLSLQASWLLNGLETLEPSQEVEWSNSASGPTLQVKEVFLCRGQPCFVVRTEYVVGPGKLEVSVHVVPTGAACNVATLPRVGLQLKLPSEMSKMSWLGYGPHETYPDRKAADWKVHCSQVDDLHVPYVVPSENGGRADVHWAAFTAPSGEGLLLQYSCNDEPAPDSVPQDQEPSKRPAGTRGAQLSASRYTMEEVEAASHRHKLPTATARPVQVHLDTAHLGVGGVGEGGSKLWATATQFFVSPQKGPWSVEELAGPGSNLLLASKDMAPRVEYLAQLQGALKQASLEARRAACRWEELLNRSLLLEDIEESFFPSMLETSTYWTCGPMRWFCHLPIFRTIWHKLVVLWLSSFRQNLCRILGIAAGLLSVMILLSQPLILLDLSWPPPLSMVGNSALSFGAAQLLSTVAVGYLVGITHWSSFRWPAA